MHTVWWPVKGESFDEKTGQTKHCAKEIIGKE